MRFSTTLILAATTYSANARALPHPAPPPTYNVVDVGGPTSAADEPATVYETVQTTLSAKQTVTAAVPAATITSTLSVATVEVATSTTTSSSQWTVVIGTVTSSSSASYITSTSSSTSTPCPTSSTTEPVYPVERPTHTADDGFYHPSGNDGQYRPWKPTATTLSTSTATGYYAVATATSWDVPMDETSSY
ncbi:hypothetical protein BST61_g2138 [Cercospora zeina]